MTIAELGLSSIDATALVLYTSDAQHEPPSYYWCCSTCGNCGKHRRLLETAAGEAALHVHNHGGTNGS